MIKKNCVGNANYYVLVDNSSDHKDYSLTTTFSETSSTRESEPKYDQGLAQYINFGDTITGQSASYSDDDYFKFDSNTGTVSVAFTGF